jgi:hypothetical protein
MGKPILIIGKSGSGKSASLRNFKDAGIVNVLGKEFPFKNNLKALVTDDYGRIKSALKDAKANSIVIDDAGYLITNHFMNNHSAAGAGNAIFAFYNELGDKFWSLVRFVVEQLPSERIVYFIMHEEKNEFGDIKPKTIGKLLDEKVCLEGLFTIVLRAKNENGKYIFKTKTDGLDVVKTPIGMFESAEIDNDLQVVDKAIRDYYELDAKSKEPKIEKKIITKEN